MLDHCVPQGRDLRRILLPLAIAATTAAVATPALAGKPSIETEVLAGEAITCGETLLTFTDDAVLTDRSHEHALGQDRVRVVAISKLTRGHLVDEDGNSYRVAGGRTLNVILEGKGAGGHAHTRYVIRGHGLHGTVNFHVYLSESFDPIFRDTGNCTRS
jgi:hypothetical protein